MIRYLILIDVSNDLIPDFDFDWCIQWLDTWFWLMYPMIRYLILIDASNDLIPDSEALETYERVLMCPMIRYLILIDVSNFKRARQI